MTVFVEDWAATYGSPYLVPQDDAGLLSAVLVEDGAVLRVHTPDTGASARTSIAFVDGVRRGEASLYQHDPASGSIGRGVAGAHGCGAVLVWPGDRPEFGEARVRRMVIWGSGLIATLPQVEGGWAWDSASIADSAPDAPLRELQTRMREEEGRLGESLCEAGHLVIVDGPLNFVRSRDLPIVGYVKTHHRALLEPDLHARIPELTAGQRTSLFRLGADRYSCYLRLTTPTPAAGPWSGIVRLEVPQSAGIKASTEVTSMVAALIPRFAGVAHRDARAPQNLQPIGALESYLRHLLGHAGLASRAVREAVSRLAS